MALSLLSTAMILSQSFNSHWFCWDKDERAIQSSLEHTSCSIFSYFPSPTPFLDLIHGPQHMKGNCKPGTRCVNAEAAAASSWEMVRALATQQLRSERDGGGRAVTRLLTRAKFVKIQEVSSSSQFQRSWALSSVLKEGWPLVPIIVNCLKICLLNNYTVQWPLWKSSCFSLLPFNSTPPAQTRGMCRLLG